MCCSRKQFGESSVKLWVETRITLWGRCCARIFFGSHCVCRDSRTSTTVRYPTTLSGRINRPDHCRIYGTGIDGLYRDDSAVIDVLVTVGSGVIGLTVIGFTGGALLQYASKAFKVEGNPLVESIDELLPQTQCGQCGHPGCKPYAEAIAHGESINRCPPGGQTTVDRIASLLGVESLPLDADTAAADQDLVALIIEEECIGCTKCIQACPVDAIVGAAKLMHTVIVDDCTGCDLCIDPCPVDCIDMVERPKAPDYWTPIHPKVISTDRFGQIEMQHG